MSTRRRVKELFAKKSPVIIYERFGEPLARAKPDSVKQTRKSKAAAKIFGVASHLAKSIRVACSPAIPDPNNQATRNKLNTAVYQWLIEKKRRSGTKQPVTISGFKFNEKAPWEKFTRLLQPEWTPSGELLLNLKAFKPGNEFTAPRRTASLTILAMVGVFAIDGTTKTTHREEIHVPYTKKLIGSQQLRFPVGLPKQSLAIVTVSIEPDLHLATDTYKGKWPVTGILDALYTGNKKR